MTSTGGSNASCRQDGRELYYVDAAGTLTALPVKLGDRAEIGKPVPLFSARNYEPAPDGQRFLVAEPLPDKEPPVLHVIVNWPALMK